MFRSEAFVKLASQAASASVQPWKGDLLSGASDLEWELVLELVSHTCLCDWEQLLRHERKETELMLLPFPGKGSVTADGSNMRQCNQRSIQLVWFWWGCRHQYKSAHENTYQAFLSPKPSILSPNQANNWPQNPLNLTMKLCLLLQSYCMAIQAASFYQIGSI